MKDAYQFLAGVLPLLFYPAGLTFLLSLLGLAAVVRKRKKRAVFLVVLALTVFTVSSLPMTSHLLSRSLESRHPPRTEYPEASAVVLLGGAEVPAEPPRIYPETNVNGDRILHAARLYRQGAAPYIIPTGGVFVTVKNFTGSAADVSTELLTELFGIPGEAILREGESQNTGDHASTVRAVLEERGLPPSIILVTSARHMPRSVKVFEKAGFTVTPAPTDFSANEEFVWSARSVVPTAVALDKTTRALHEYYGLVVYRILGWIE